MNELLPWNWKTDRNHTLATYAGAGRTPLLRLSRTRVRGAHVPWSLPDGYSGLSSENLSYEAAIPSHDSFRCDPQPFRMVRTHAFHERHYILTDKLFLRWQGEKAYLF